MLAKQSTSLPRRAHMVNDVHTQDQQQTHVTQVNLITRQNRVQYNNMLYLF
jgi:hypothetical protein